jgi:tryptophan-rich sensory protein
MNKTTKILVLVATCLAIGYLSGISTKSSIETWYPKLIKPFFNPPNWIFGPVWSFLYILMGVSGGLIWNKIETEKEAVKSALLFFAIQLALNSLWSFIFFGLNNIFLALIEMVLLWLMIYETYIKFKKIDKLAANLLLPYLSWVSFAMILNASICWLNR